MDFLKKHYEKVLLGAVLLGLVAATASLPFVKASQDEALTQLVQKRTTIKVKPLPAIDMSGDDAALKRAAEPLRVDFSVPHKLFNPMPWQKAVDGHLIKVNSTNVGPLALVVLTNAPLYLRLTLDAANTNEGTGRYTIGVQKEASTKSDERVKRQRFCSIGQKTDMFILRAVQGPADNPTNVVLELTDTGETVNLSKEQPFKRVDGYTVALKYQPEGKSWTDRRVGNVLPFNNQEYTISHISDSEVILVEKSNQKKWNIKYHLNAST